MQVALTEEKRVKLGRKPFFKSETEILDANEEFNGAEIHMRKKKIEDDKPLHVNVAILQFSKLLFMEFMYFIKDHLIDGTYRTCYADTGEFQSNIKI